MVDYKTVTYGSIDVCYLDEIDGGGARFGQDYLSFISDHVGKVDRILEWCAGPGFIGFSLLAAGLCDELALIDVNPAAVASCQETVRRNGLDDSVRVYTSDCMDALPQGNVYDLVVANPPHCPDSTPSPGGHTQLIYNDIGWRIHEKFYRQIPRYLSDAGRVLLQEDASQSSADDFRAMIEDAGLELTGVYPCAWAKEYYPPRGTRLYPEYYYVESRLAARHSARRLAAQ
ncbi:methyltransferase family protein [Nocardia tenerifensis]|uniref:Methyltransferase family protein n=1 Tax=Nocardia tenerifensis TaxID=228006 RepID=A0A318K4N1_9NOCA|nr:methyltransferase [Nocardia tenerifensis]PXX63904.1 methyltransferase family protein [Nocardia tenerifensis]